MVIIELIEIHRHMSIYTTNDDIRLFIFIISINVNSNSKGL